MANLTEITAELITMDIMNKVCSKVNGRRNYVIRTENGKIVFAGGYGTAKRYGWLSEYLTYITEHHVRWYEFTYKKDFDEACALLKRE